MISNAQEAQAYVHSGLKLRDLLCVLKTNVPIEVIEIEPPEYPDNLDSKTMLYNSEYVVEYSHLNDMLCSLFDTRYEFIVESILLSDSDYQFRLRIFVLRK